MIDSHTVNITATEHLKAKLKTAPGALQYLLEQPRFGKWVRLCQLRLNQLDIEGYVRNQNAIHVFVRQAVEAFARKQLEKIDHSILK